MAVGLTTLYRAHSRTHVVVGGPNIHITLTPVQPLHRLILSLLRPSRDWLASPDKSRCYCSREGCLTAQQQS